MTDPVTSGADLTRQIQRILQLGQISRQEHFQLVSRSLSNLKTSPEERQQINRILDQVQMGAITFAQESPVS